MSIESDRERRPVRAAVVDLDGVVTRTAAVHERSWKEVFDGLLEEHGFPEPFTPADYRRYVDGKPRYEGAASFLEARGIALPRGGPEDPPGHESICAVGNLKNETFHRLVAREGVAVFEDAVDMLERWRRAGLRTAVVSSSRNAAEVLRAADLEPLFQARVDGSTGEELGLRGKPAPDYFLEAARRLGVAPQEAMVVEDATSGVRAARQGGFGLVVGVSRDGNRRELRESGADVVVGVLGELGEHPVAAEGDT